MIGRVVHVSVELSTSRYGPYSVVTVRGDLDVTSYRRVDEYLKAVERQASRVVVDLAGLTFLDSTGLSVLVRHWRDLVAAGGTFTVARASYSSARVLWTTGLIGRIPQVADLAELAEPADFADLADRDPADPPGEG
jgi:anti-anti-sigma factor